MYVKMIRIYDRSSILTRECKLNCGFRALEHMGRQIQADSPFIGTREPGPLRVPMNPEPTQDFGLPDSTFLGTHNKFPRRDNKSVCELLIISKMGSRSLETEP